MAVTQIEIKNDVTRSKEDVEGSDGRMNVSSRTDSRSYYNSRDVGQTYSMAWMFNVGEGGEYAAYLRNDSTDGKHLVVEATGLNCDSNARFKLHFVTGTAAGGTSLTPTNMNTTSPNAANATGMEGGSAATGITGLTPDALIDHAFVGANSHEEFRLKDRLRLGQNDAIAVELDEGTTADCAGVIFFYFE